MNDYIDESSKYKKKVRTEDEMDAIAVDVVKVLLEQGVAYEDIEQLSGKTIEEIKRIGGITD